MSKLVEKFQEVVDEVRGVGAAYDPECVNRVQKEAYICKRMKISRQIEEE